MCFIKNLIVCLQFFPMKMKSKIKDFYVLEKPQIPAQRQKLPLVPLYPNQTIDPQSKILHQISYSDALAFFSTLPEDSTYTSNKTTGTVYIKNTKAFLITYNEYHVKIKLLDKTNARFTNHSTLPNSRITLKKYQPYFTEEEAKEHVNNGFPSKHPFCKFGKKIVGYCEPSLQEYITAHCYSESGKKRIQKIQNPPISEEFFQKYEGYTRIYLQSNLKLPMKFQNQKESIGIKALVHIVPEFQDIIKQDCKTIELDCSFFVLWPYVYCIPTIIIMNESVPIGLSVGPTESNLIFQQFYDFLKDVDPETYKILQYIKVLSDEGKAIKLFCNNNSIEQILCYRHIINKFGAGSKLGGLVRGLLFCQTYESFKQFWDQIKNTLISEFEKSDEKRKKQFLDLFQCNYDPELHQFTEPQFQQSMWNRLGSPTCTNHVESGHSHLNATAASCRVYNKRLSIIMNYIRSRISVFWQRRNLMDAITKIKALAKTDPKIDQEECHCSPNHFKSALYGVDFPCVHNVKSFQMPKNLPKPEKSPIKQFVQIVSDLNSDYLQWELPQPKLLPEFDITDDDITISNVYGRPKKSYIMAVVKIIPQINDVSTMTLFNYLTLLFIHYSGEFYGYYEYKSPFQTFALSWISKEFTFEEYRKIHPTISTGKVISCEERNSNIIKAEVLSTSGDFTTEDEMIGKDPLKNTVIHEKHKDDDENHEEVIQNEIKEPSEDDEDDEEVIQNEIKEPSEDDEDDEEVKQNEIKERALKLSLDLQEKFCALSKQEIDANSCIEYLKKVFEDMDLAKGTFEKIFEDQLKK